jgi:hypothetical protein
VWSFIEQLIKYIAQKLAIDLLGGLGTMKRERDGDWHASRPPAIAVHHAVQGRRYEVPKSESRTGIR